MIAAVIIIVFIVGAAAGAYGERFRYPVPSPPPPIEPTAHPYRPLHAIITPSLLRQQVRDLEQTNGMLRADNDRLRWELWNRPRVTHLTIRPNRIVTRSAGDGRGVVSGQIPRTAPLKATESPDRLNLWSRP